MDQPLLPFRKAEADCMYALSIRSVSIVRSGREVIIVAAGTVSRIIKVNKLDGKNIANDINILRIVVQGYETRTNQIEDALFAHNLFRPDQKFYNNVFADILGKNILHGAAHFFRIKILLRRRLKFRGALLDNAGCFFTGEHVIAVHKIPPKY